MNAEDFPVYKGTEPYLFASYSHADWRLVNGILRILSREGFRIWYDKQDKGISVGADWKETIDERISNCSVFVIFLSLDEEERSEVLREFELAESQQKTIIPVMLERVPINRFPDNLKNLVNHKQYIGLWKYGGVTEDFARQLLVSDTWPEGIVDSRWRKKQGLPEWNPEKIDIREDNDERFNTQYIFSNAFPRPKEGNLQGKTFRFYQISPGETAQGALYPLAMDNQWCPEAFYRDSRFRKSGLASRGIRQEREVLQRNEFYRSLLHSYQVIVNRAYLQNNPIFMSWYREGADEKDQETLGRLFERGVIVPFLYREDTPCDSPDYATLDLSEWQKFCLKHPMYCLRMDWDDEETNNLETEDRISLAFHDFCVTLAEDYHRLDSLAKCFGITDKERASQFRERWKQIQAKAIRFKEKNNGRSYCREEFYKDFLVCPDTKVVDCRLNRKEKFTKELKRVIDFLYNRNLTRALGIKILAPWDFRIIADSLGSGEADFGRREVNIEELVYAIDSFSSDFLLPEVWSAETEDLTLTQVDKMRQLQSWRNYISAMTSGQKRSVNWDIDLHDIAVVWNRYQVWTEAVRKKFPELHWKSEQGAVSVIYRFGGKEWISVYRAGEQHPAWRENKVKIGPGKVSLTIDYVCGDLINQPADNCLRTEIRFFEGQTHEAGALAAKIFRQRVVEGRNNG